MTEGLIEPTDVEAELEAELVVDAAADDALAEAVTEKVDEIITGISGQRLVDGAWLVDQLLDVSNLATPVSPIAGLAFAVVGELRGRTLVDRTWAVDQLLDLRASITDRNN